MSLYKGNNKVAGSSNYTVNPDDISNSIVEFSDSVDGFTHPPKILLIF